MYEKLNKRLMSLLLAEGGQKNERTTYSSAIPKYMATTTIIESN